MTQFYLVKKSLVWFVLVFIILTNFSSISNFQNINESATANSVTPLTNNTVQNLNTGKQFTTIQAALDIASAGDTIFIHNGTYVEHLNISKSISLIGENNTNTTISGGRNGIVINITSSGVNISYLMISTSGGNKFDAGVKIFRESNCKITNCSFNNNLAGVSIDNSYNVTIENCKFSDNSYGIYLPRSNNISIYHCGFSNNYAGVDIYNSENCSIADNSFYSNSFSSIYLSHSFNNLFVNNFILGWTSYGFYLKNSNYNLIDNNNVSFCELTIYLESSDENYILNNNIVPYPIYYEYFYHYSDMVEGINLFKSDRNFISNNTLQFLSTGIQLNMANNNSITENYLFNNTCGIQLSNTIGNIIEKNTIISQNDYQPYSIYMWDNINISIQNNTLLFGGLFLFRMVEDIRYWNSHEVANNTINGKSLIYLKNNSDQTVTDEAGQVILVNCTNITIENQNIINCTIGISLVYSNSNLIVNNSIERSNLYGIYLHYSDNNTIVNNSVINSNYGISLQSSDYNKIENNNISSKSLDDAYSSIGISISFSQNLSIKNNTIYNHIEAGIEVINSENIIFINNTFFSNTYGIQCLSSLNLTLRNNSAAYVLITFGSEQLKYFKTHDIDHSNKVNDKPVYYWKDRNNETIPNDAGQIILINCTDIKVEHQNISKMVWPIILYFSNSNIISNNNISNNHYWAIQLYYSHNNLLRNNYISNNSQGIYLEFSTGNTISQNYLSDNNCGISVNSGSKNNTVINNDICSNSVGIELFSTSNNHIIGNTIFGNQEGLQVYSSSNNMINNNTIFLNNIFGINYYYFNLNNYIFNNNFISNHPHGQDAYKDNFWNYSYPTGGNYWSDYEGKDEYSGAAQDQPGSDGIGDTSYEIEGLGYITVFDQYPLMEPVPIDTRLSLPPTQPQNLKVNAGNEYIELTWTPPKFTFGQNITGYNIYRGMVNSYDETVEITENILIYNDTNVTNGQEYLYKISAITQSGEGAISTTDTGIPRNTSKDDNDEINDTTEPEDTENDGDESIPVLRYLLLSIIIISSLALFISHILSKKRSKSNKEKVSIPEKTTDDAEDSEESFIEIPKKHSSNKANILNRNKNNNY